MKDWIAEAAREIDKRLIEHLEVGYGPKDPLIIEIIRRYSPFKDAAAYMPVPRCDGCSHWSRLGLVPGEYGRCAQSLDLFACADGDPADDVRTSADFGCVQWKAK